MPASGVHILGLGGLGKLLAHSLRKYHPELPITLLFHRSNLIEQWDEAGRRIEVVRDGQSNLQAGFEFENVSQHQGKIHNLIIATKTYSTVQALQPLKDRLGPWSTMLFLQNGIGTTDEVTSKVFNGGAARPNYLAGIVNHGVYSKSQFSFVHAGIANAVLGPVFPSDVETSKAPEQDQFLVQHILSCPILSASSVASDELLHIQLQKLAINSVINPLTVIFDCLNGEIFKSASIRILIYRIIAEVSAVIQAILASKSQSPNAALLDRFSTDNLTQAAFDVGEKTSKNISSMRQDFRAGRGTEIDYINGYIVDQAKKLGISCPTNKKVVELVKARTNISETQIADYFSNS